MSKIPEPIVSKQFLVTDDYESMRMMIAEHLKELGIQKILFAKSGNEALEIIKKNLGGPNQIDFLLTDMVMENGTGIDLARGVRAEPSLKGLPILMITSKSEVNLVIEAVKAGVNNYVVKPWQLDDLAKKIIDSWNKAKGTK
jgi:two-component system chemotaxis response regulator CheY